MPFHLSGIRDKKKFVYRVHEHKTNNKMYMNWILRKIILYCEFDTNEIRYPLNKKYCENEISFYKPYLKNLIVNKIFHKREMKTCSYFLCKIHRFTISCRLIIMTILELRSRFPALGQGHQVVQVHERRISWNWKSDKWNWIWKLCFQKIFH